MTFPIDVNCWNYSLHKTYRRLEKTWGITPAVFPIDESYVEYMNRLIEEHAPIGD